MSIYQHFRKHKCPYINILEYYIIDQNILKDFFLSKTLIIAVSDVSKVPHCSSLNYKYMYLIMKNFKHFLIHFSSYNSNFHFHKFRLFNSLNGISHIVGFLENTLILDQSSIHHVCCIYLSCDLVFFQMLYKTIQITK